MDPRATGFSRKDIFLGVQHIAQGWEFPEVLCLLWRLAPDQENGCDMCPKILGWVRGVAVDCRSHWFWWPELLHESYPLHSGQSCQ